jgi:hypothetical protein
MKYCRIDLSKTNYSTIKETVFFFDPPVAKLQAIYQEYCAYKQFTSVMPIFDSQFTDSKNTIIGYYNLNDRHDLVAFSIIRQHDNENVEAVQFAWNYRNPEQRWGRRSLEHECALYKRLGCKYLYLGEAADYKSELDGYEVLGPNV